jgi:hypothetical protein
LLALRQLHPSATHQTPPPSIRILHSVFHEGPHPNHFPDEFLKTPRQKAAKVFIISSFTNNFQKSAQAVFSETTTVASTADDSHGLIKPVSLGNAADFSSQHE